MYDDAVDDEDEYTNLSFISTSCCFLFIYFSHSIFHLLAFLISLYIIIILIIKRITKEHITATAADVDGMNADSNITASIAKFKSKRDRAQARIQERKERRAASEILIKAIRNLKRRKALNTNTAKFWEGALGNASYKPVMFKEAKRAFDEKGILIAISKALELFDAMHARDVPTMASLLMYIKDEDLQIFDGIHIGAF